MTSAHSPEHTAIAPGPARLLPGARHLLGHLLIPVYLALGMSLAYLGAFHRAEPHALPVAIVGQSASTSVLATTIGDRAGAQLVVRTVPTAADARQLVGSGTLVAAYQPVTGAGTPTLIIDSSASPTAADTATTVFDTVAATQSQRVVIDDLHPLPATDHLGNNLFFLLVALTVGGYTAAATLGVAGAAARVPYRVRTLLAVLTAGVIAVIGTVVAGPVIGAVHGNLVELALLAWLYVGGLAVFGSALHAFFGRFTTAVLVTLFVMLNFTSSGGVFDPRLQAGIFSGLSNIWNGSAFLRAARGLIYRDGAGTPAAVAVLLAWLVLGLALVALAARVTRRRDEAARTLTTRPAATAGDNHASPTAAEEIAEDEELEEGVLAT